MSVHPVPPLGHELLDDVELAFFGTEQEAREAAPRASGAMRALFDLVVQHGEPSGHRWRGKISADAVLAKRHESHKELRLYLSPETGASWKKDVKLTLEVTSAGALLRFGTWMTSKEHQAAFDRWMRYRQLWIRDRVIALSSELERQFGRPLLLLLTSRRGSDEARARRFVSNERDWRVWQANERGQAAIALDLSFVRKRDLGQSLENIDETERHEALERVIGYRLPGNASPQVACRQADAQLYELLSSGGATLALLTAIRGLLPLYEDCHRYRTRSPAAWPGSPAWERPAREIEGALEEAAQALGMPGLVVNRAPRATGKQLLGPSLSVKGAESRPVTLTFTVPPQQLKQGEYVHVWREQLRLELDGPNGDSVVALARQAGPALAFVRSKRKSWERVAVRSREELIEKWLTARTADGDNLRTLKLEWTIASPGGQTDWLRVPAQLFLGLLAACDPDQSRELVVPRLDAPRWNAFVSTSGAAGAVSRHLAEQLIQSGYSAWHMDHHQQTGQEISESISAAVAQSDALVALLDDGYCMSVFCVQELASALTANIPVLPVLVERTGQTTDFGRLHERAWADSACDALERLAARDPDEPRYRAAAALTRTFFEQLPERIATRIDAGDDAPAPAVVQQIAAGLDAL